MSTTTNDPTVAIAIGAIFVVIIVLVIVMAIRRREIVFNGQVIDKNIVEDRNTMPMNNMGNMNNGGINIMDNGSIQHEYYVKVKTSSGKTIKYKISSGMYEIVKIGDMVSKPKGTTEITITSNASTSTPPVSATTPSPASPTTPVNVTTPPNVPPTIPPTNPPTVAS